MKFKSNKEINGFDNKITSLLLICFISFSIFLFIVVSRYMFTKTPSVITIVSALLSVAFFIGIGITVISKLYDKLPHSKEISMSDEYIVKKINDDYYRLYFKKWWGTYYKFDAGFDKDALINQYENAYRKQEQYKKDKKKNKKEEIIHRGRIIIKDERSVDL